MEVYCKCKNGEGFRDKIHTIRIATHINICCIHAERFCNDIACSNLGCLHSRIYRFAHIINQRQMNDFDLLRLIRIKLICKLIPLKGYINVHGIACRLEFIEFACRITGFVTLFYHKGKVIQKKIFNRMIFRSSCI